MEFCYKTPWDRCHIECNYFYGLYMLLLHARPGDYLLWLRMGYEQHFMQLTNQRWIFRPAA
jgi:hypothetical protein